MSVRSLFSPKFSWGRRRFFTPPTSSTYSLAASASAFSGALQRGHVHGRQFGLFTLDDAEPTNGGLVFCHRTYLLYLSKPLFLKLATDCQRRFNVIALKKITDKDPNNNVNVR